MKDIKYGAYAPLVDYRLARQAAIAAEQSGFDFLCFGDSMNMWFPRGLWTPEFSPLAGLADVDQVMDPWLRSPLYADRTISLSDHQARANPDGSYTYVLSPKDPGVYNWIDTGDLHDGITVIRWELLAKPAVIDQAVREVRKLALVDLPGALPPEVPRVSAAERKQQQAERRADYELRIQ